MGPARPAAVAGSDNSPADCCYTAISDQTSGQIVCGTFGGAADIEWTRNRQLLVFDVHGGQDLDSLFHNWAFTLKACAHRG